MGFSGPVAHPSSPGKFIPHTSKHLLMGAGIQTFSTIDDLDIFELVLVSYFVECLSGRVYIPHFSHDYLVIWGFGKEGKVPFTYHIKSVAHMDNRAYHC